MQVILGITGGTGCGKTTVLRAVQRLGFSVIDCDALYHTLLQTDKEMLRAIGEAFPGVVTDGSLQRKILGQQVFSDPAALDKLNRTVWPFVCNAVQAAIREAAPRSCAIDAIGLFESGLDKLCTHTCAVTAPTEARIRRLMARDGITEEYAALRIGAQEQNETYAARCGIVLDNHFSTEEEFSRFAEKTLKETIL